MPSLAVVGDGGFQYGLSELATARQHAVDVALLVVDDGGYGILRDYQSAAGFAHAGVELVHPDFVALTGAFGVPARPSTPERLERELRWALETPGPALVVLTERLSVPAPRS